ncbi:hypothetical protein DV737_g2477, partial [Chaetothyriales sp. CBS 132003]
MCKFFSLSTGKPGTKERGLNLQSASFRSGEKTLDSLGEKTLDSLGQKTLDSLGQKTLDSLGQKTLDTSEQKMLDTSEQKMLDGFPMPSPAKPTAKLRFVDVAVTATANEFAGIYRNKQYHQADFDAVIHRALAAGVAKIMLTGMSLSDVSFNLEIAKRHPAICYITIGVHPYHAAEADSGDEAYLDRLAQAVDRAIQLDPCPIAAFGELGLDYDRLNRSPKEAQLRVFQRQLHLFVKHRFDLPLFLHCRAAFDDFCETIKPYLPSLPRRGLVHSFVGTCAQMKVLIEMGFDISVNAFSFRDQASLHMVREIPLDRLHIETDAPWGEISANLDVAKRYLVNAGPMPPAKKRDRFQLGAMVKDRNESCCIERVAFITAGLRGVSVEEIAAATWENSIKMFRLGHEPTQAEHLVKMRPYPIDAQIDELDQPIESQSAPKSTSQSMSVLEAMLKNNVVSKISILSRRPVSMVEGTKDPRVSVIIQEDFSKYDSTVTSKLQGASGVVWALGISQTKVSKDEYIKITKDYALAAAKAFAPLAPANEVFNFVYVSGEGATQSAGAFTPLFGRVKGETELLLARLGTADPRLKAISVRPGFVDAKAHASIHPFIPSPGVLENVARTLLASVFRVATPEKCSPTQPLGRFLVEAAMGEYDEQLKSSTAEGGLTIVDNAMFRKLAGLD